MTETEKKTRSKEDLERFQEIAQNLCFEEYAEFQWFWQSPVTHRYVILQYDKEKDYFTIEFNSEEQIYLDFDAVSRVLTDSAIKEGLDFRQVVP